MEPSSTASTSPLQSFRSLALGALFLALFASQVYRAAALPIRPTEAYTYDHFVRPTLVQIWYQELPNPDVLYTLLEKRSVGLFHVSPFSVRLPSLLFFLLYCYSLWRLARRYLGSRLLFVVAILSGALCILRWDWFSTADGTGAALALQLTAVVLIQSPNPRNLNLAGAFLGLSSAARLEFALPAALLSLLLLCSLALQDRTRLWLDRVLIPAILVAFAFLILPLTHAHAPSQAPSTDFAINPAPLDLLRTLAGLQPVRIAASPDLESIVNFYRAQHRANTWERASRNPASGAYDYYLLLIHDSALVEQRHLSVLYRDADVLLARSN